MVKGKVMSINTVTKNLFIYSLYTKGVDDDEIKKEKNYDAPKVDKTKSYY